MKGLLGSALLALAATMVVDAQQAMFRSSVDVVSVPVSITDKNRPVGKLTANDLELLDNDVKQEITVTPIDDLPTDVTFLVDISGSINGKAFDRITKDVQEMASLAQPNDRVRLVAFARDAVDVFGVLPGGATLDFTRMVPGGTTSLYDSLVTVLAASSSTDRPHLVFVVTDGRDNASFATAEHVIAMARTSSAVLCIALVQSSNPLVREGGKLDAIDPLASEQSAVNVPTGSATRLIPGINLPGVSGASGATVTVSRNAGPFKGDPNVAALREATAATGGVLQVDSSRVPVPSLFRSVLDDFRASYVVSYTPTGVTTAGHHALVIKTQNAAYVVRARKSYDVR